MLCNRNKFNSQSKEYLRTLWPEVSVMLCQKYCTGIWLPFTLFFLFSVAEIGNRLSCPLSSSSPFSSLSILNGRHLSADLWKRRWSLEQAVTSGQCGQGTVPGEGQKKLRGRESGFFKNMMSINSFTNVCTVYRPTKRSSTSIPKMQLV